MPPAYLIGTDEAGYGPNLGPLVISATVWRVPEGVRGDDLYSVLGSCVARSPQRVGQSGSAAVAIGDSKALYQPTAGLRHLERGVLAALAVLRRRPTTWREAWHSLARGEWRGVRGEQRVASGELRLEIGESSPGRLTPIPSPLTPHPSPLSTLPWYADYDAPIPLDADPADAESAALILSDGLAAAGVELLGLCSRPVFADEFNRLVDRCGSKGTALSQATLELVGALVEPLDEGPIWIVCDKHGGRNRYGRLLSERFPERLIEIHGESRQRSVYRFGPQERRIEIRFQTKAESHLPAALASMASKYLRELAMWALNEFWCRRVEGLRPTAGYPHDAKRFKAQIAAVQAELGIDDRLLWRTR